MKLLACSSSRLRKRIGKQYRDPAEVRKAGAMAGDEMSG
jgi:hypothetical protein